MKRKIILPLLALICICLKTNKLSAQATTTNCFDIQSILVDACGTPEGLNEMVRFLVGPSPLNVGNLNVVTWSTASIPYTGICKNAASANAVASLNATILGCGYIKEPVGGVLPANSTVILATSPNISASANSFANLNDTIYMIFPCSTSNTGHFGNYNSTPGTNHNFFMSFGGACNDLVTYDSHLLIDQSGGSSAQDGATVNFDFAGNATYTNTGCQAPFIPLQATLSASNTSVCPGTLINISAVITSGNYSSFFWKNGQGVYGSTTSLNTTYQTNATYIGNDALIFGIVTNCNDTVFDTLNISINSSIPVVIATSGPTTFCSGDSVILTANGSGTFLWSNGATTSSITALTSNTYSVTATSTCGISNANQVVTVNTLAPAVITANGPTTFCTGDSVKLSTSVVGTYLWSNGATTNSITVFNTNTYTVTITETCGVTSTSQSVTATNAVTVVIAASGPTTLCTGDSITLTANGVGNYLWSNGATTSAITVFTTSNYMVTATSSCGISNANQQVTFNPGAVALINANGPTTFCNGDSVQLTATGGASFLWSNGATTASITVNISNTYTVTATATCGSSSTSQNVIVNTVPITVVNVTGPTTICQGTNAILTASGATTYLWSNGATTSSITVGTANNYTVTGSNNCGSSNDGVTITVNPLPMAVIAPLGGITTFCTGGSVTLQGSGGTTYLWSDGSTTSSILVTVGGTYTLTATNNCGTNTTSQITTETSPPIIILNATSTVLCPNDNSVLTVTSSAINYVWSTGEISNSINVNSAGTYVVTATNFCGSDLDSVVITQSNLSASFIADTITGSAPLTVHFKNTSQFANTFNWDFGDGKFSTDTNPTHIFSKDGYYLVVLTVTDTNGCIDTASQTIIVITDSAAWVPNVFTPNGDQKNDVFNILGVGINTIDARIFNRWGAEVYTWSTLTTGWDGKHNGKDSPAGAYYYLIKITYNNGKHDLLRGNVTLLR